MQRSRIVGDHQVRLVQQGGELRKGRPAGEVAGRAGGGRHYPLSQRRVVPAAVEEKGAPETALRPPRPLPGRGGAGEKEGGGSSAPPQRSQPPPVAIHGMFAIGVGRFDPVGVEPVSAFARCAKAYPSGRSRQRRHEPGPQQALQVDHEVESPPPQLAREFGERPEGGSQTAFPAVPIERQRLVEIGMAAQERFEAAVDDPGDARVGEAGV